MAKFSRTGLHVHDSTPYIGTRGWALTGMYILRGGLLHACTYSGVGSYMHVHTQGWALTCMYILRGGLLHACTYSWVGSYMHYFMSGIHCVVMSQSVDE